jgi:hypothetical protein
MDVEVPGVVSEVHKVSNHESPQGSPHAIPFWGLGNVRAEHHFFNHHDQNFYWH